MNPVKKLPSKDSTGAPTKNANIKNENWRNQKGCTNITVQCDIRGEKKPYNGTRAQNTNAQKYNNRSRNQIINHLTTFKNVPTVFPMEPKKTKLHIGTG